ncbi:MBL fold metallo-hydrolase [Hymenobacter guriensis]|uniref:3',5'-cyclic-nucleotide phosphodiesterase n=1 Tax=Hymenobacter guriensis TaxID=2793065 RepID=A0ABS0KVP0_9BACT|nr:3',5'-cyclic-nucleotide phosphodiesterase [Hymenobacter guriensis]MBG8551911.1 3',5'-cyclic-nucleotide phosphodiesterase [Hymenobacter guriensis]
MSYKRTGCICLVLWLLTLPAIAQTTFTVVPLGVRGGGDESNLSCYLVAAAGTSAYIGLDAGTVRAGLVKAVAAQTFRAPVEAILRDSIRGYCLSHPHLDHVAGLLLNAPDDARKPLYGLPGCLETLQKSYFNWQAWPNFGPGGAAPALGKYQFQPLAPGPETSLAGTDLFVRVFPLSHGPGYESAAFLVRHHSSYLLYLGDTGADALEKSGRLRALWQVVAPLVQRGQLKALFIEASYPNEQPENQLFGHLTPRLLLQELDVLAQLAGPKALRGLPVVVTHSKPAADNEALIQRQLGAANGLGVRFVFPQQGQRLGF